MEGYLMDEMAQSYPDEVNTLVHAILERAENREGVVGILFYGSGLWKDGGKKADEDTVWDLHVLVDQYRDFDPSWGLAFAGSILPHNVYYMDVPGADGKTLRCKFNVMRASQFQNHTRGRCVTPQIWARFCQPCRLVYARHERVKVYIADCLKNCVVIFMKRAVPWVNEGDDLWETGFTQTYKDELRSEKGTRGSAIVEASVAAFQKRSDLMGAIHMSEDMKLGHRIFRRVLRPIKKFVHLVRLMKSLLTFDGALDYAVWKIHRHSGEEVELTDFQRKYPLIGGWPVLWKLKKQGVLK